MIIYNSNYPPPTNPNLLILLIPKHPPIMNDNKFSVRIVLLILFFSVFIYFGILTILRVVTSYLKPNEFGDFIGGVLNPLFTIISTSALIYLTYILGEKDASKADEAISAQKRITINQMRQDAFSNLISKLNLFAHNINENHFHNVKQGSLMQKFITNNLKNIESNQVWLITLFEIEAFKQLNYLFGDLYKKEEFINSCESLENSLELLIHEQNETKINTLINLEVYIREKQSFQTLIGDYILEKF